MLVRLLATKDMRSDPESTKMLISSTSHCRQGCIYQHSRKDVTNGTALMENGSPAGNRLCVEAPV